MMKKFVFILLLIITISCNEIKLDSIGLNDHEIVLINSNYNQFLLKNYHYKKWTPTANEIKILHDVINVAIQNNEFFFLKKPIIKNINKLYYRQYIPYINENGERMIEINAFIETMYDVPLPLNTSTETFNWKRDYYQVYDGGISVWHLIINVDKKTHDKVRVNGEA